MNPTEKIDFACQCLLRSEKTASRIVNSFRGEEPTTSIEELALSHRAWLYATRELLLRSKDRWPFLTFCDSYSSNPRSDGPKIWLAWFLSENVTDPSKLRHLDSEVRKLGELLQLYSSELEAAVYRAEDEQSVHYRPLVKRFFVLRALDYAREEIHSRVDEYFDTSARLAHKLLEERAVLEAQNAHLAREVKDKSLRLKNQTHKHARQRGHMASEGGRV